MLIGAARICYRVDGDYERLVDYTAWDAFPKVSAVDGEK
jgi:hypothetical protein